MTGYRLPESNLPVDSQLPGEGALASWREIRGLEKGGQKHQGRKEQGEP